LRLSGRFALPLLFLIAMAGASLRAGAEIIDRVLAVVDGALITQSDVLEAIRLGLVSVPGGSDPVPPTLDALVERRLILAEVDRYAPPDPAPAEVERALDAVRSRVGPAALDAILLQTGSSLDALRTYLRDDLRSASYLQQRFGIIQPTESDVAQYYSDHAAELGQRSLPQVRGEVVSALTKQRRDAVIRDWVAGLRRRANINILPR
jgi:hypothetical protein